MSRADLRVLELAAARVVAAFTGLFALANLVGELIEPGFGINGWWLDFRPLPAVVTVLLLVPASALLTAWGFRPRAGHRRLRATGAALALLLAVALWNSVAFYALSAIEAIDPALPLPLSLLVAATIVWLRRVLSGQERLFTGAEAGNSRLRLAGVVAVTLAALLLGWPLAQIFFFGQTDYRRSADAAVVFGAAVWPGGQPSQALTDRVMTAIELYHTGLVARLIFSGGPGQGEDNISESEAMARMARTAGVREEDILVDPEGINTQATVINSAALADSLGMRRLLAVSHFYHLPRIKLTYARAGLEVHTVPARESRPLLGLPWYIAREIAALWVYYVRPLWE